MVAELTRLAREKFGEEATVLEFAVDWTESGHTLTQLAKLVSKSKDLDGKEISRAMVSRYLHSLADDAADALAAAEVIGADGLVDQSVEIADKAVDKDDAAVARVQVNARQWLAERRNKKKYGAAKQDATVNINIGSLHHQALLARETREDSDDRNAPARRVSSESRGDESAIVSAIVQDAEVVSVEPATS